MVRQTLKYEKLMRWARCIIVKAPVGERMQTNPDVEAVAINTPDKKMTSSVSPYDQSSFGPGSKNVKCAYCNRTVDTKTSTAPNSKAWLTGALLCVFGCVLCAWIPCCCCPEWSDVTHYCPICNSILGKHKGN